MSEARLQLQSIQDQGHFSDLEQKIFKILNDVLQPDVTVDSTDAAKRIDALGTNPLAENGNQSNIMDFLWSFWDLVIKVMQHVPRHHQGQTRMMALLDSLSQISRGTTTIWGSEARLWKDLPLLGPCMRDNWISPTYNDSVLDSQLAEKWASLNSFAARLLAGDLARWINFAVWELSAALEEEIQDPTILDSNIAVAEEWIFHAGGRLLREARDDSKEDPSMKKSGSLYKGKEGLNLDRWQFWKQRFVDIGKQTSGDVSKRSHAVATRMDEIEGKSD